MVILSADFEYDIFKAEIGTVCRNVDFSADPNLISAFSERRNIKNVYYHNTIRSEGGIKQHRRTAGHTKWLRSRPRKRTSIENG